MSDEILSGAINVGRYGVPMTDPEPVGDVAAVRPRGLERSSAKELRERGFKLMNIIDEDNRLGKHWMAQDGAEGADGKKIAVDRGGLKKAN